MIRTPIRLRVVEVVERRRFCPRCDAGLTETDLEIGCCTQCGAEIEREGEDGEDDSNE